MVRATNRVRIHLTIVGDNASQRAGDERTRTLDRLGLVSVNDAEDSSSDDELALLPRFAEQFERTGPRWM